MLDLPGDATGRQKSPGNTPALGRIPRVARWMALAIRLERHVQTGGVPNFAELARLGQVSRAWVSQILALLQLAPDLQEAVLFLPLTVKGRDVLHLRQLLPIAATLDWQKQRRMWARLGQPTPPSQKP